MKKTIALIFLAGALLVSCTPKKENTASAAKYPGSDKDKNTIAVVQRFGNISFVIIRQLDAPCA